MHGNEGDRLHSNLVVLRVWRALVTRWIAAKSLELNSKICVAALIPGHPWDEKGLQRQKGVGVLVWIPRMKDASRPVDEPLTNRG